METIELNDEAFADLRTAFRQNRFDTECFLDTEEGEVVWFSSDAPVREKPDDEEPDWVKEAYEKRFQIWQDGDGRYVEVPPHDISQACADMETYLEEHATDRLAERFESSSMHRRTYEVFTDAVERNGRDRRNWREFRRKQVAERIRDWLELEGYRLELC